MIEGGERNYLFVTENYRTENPNIAQNHIDCVLPYLCRLSTHSDLLQEEA